MSTETFQMTEQLAWVRLGKLLDKRVWLHESMTKMVEEAGDAGLTDEQRAGWDRMDAEFNSLTEKITPLQKAEDRAKAEVAGSRQEPGALVFRDLKTGSDIRALRSNENWADLPPARNYASHGRDLDCGNFLAGMITGVWRDEWAAERQLAAECRTLTVGTDSAGGFSVPEPIRRQFIDKARAQSVLIRAGAITLPMTSKTLDTVRLSTDMSPGWRAEGAAIAESTPALERVRLDAEVVATYLKLSVELADDSVNIGQVIETALTGAMAAEMDRVGLVGAGSSNEPQGIKGATGVGTVDMDDQPPANYDDWSNAVQTVREANLEPNAAIMSPRTMGQLDRLKDTTNQPLQPPQSFAGLTKFTTANVPDNLTGTGSPTATDNSVGFVGKFDQMVFGIREEMRIDITRSASDGTDDAFKQLLVMIRTWARMDVALMRPTGFVTINNIGSG